jgi:hypothetical protein
MVELVIMQDEDGGFFLAQLDKTNSVRTEMRGGAMSVTLDVVIPVYKQIQYFHSLRSLALHLGGKCEPLSKNDE